MRLAILLADHMLAASAMLPIEMWRAAASTASGRSRAADELRVDLLAAQLLR